MPSVDAITLHTRTGISLEFVYIASGTYTAGRNIERAELALRSLGNSAAALDEGSKRSRMIDAFYMCRHQITASQFATFLNDVSPEIAVNAIVLNARSNVIKESDRDYYAPRKNASRYPANTVTWEGAIEFSKWFAGKTGWFVRIPSEAEWEAAARTRRGFLVPTGGENRNIANGDDLAPRITTGTSQMDVDELKNNVTVTGLFHTLNSVGDWTNDIYQSDEENDIPDWLVGETKGGHVLKRCLNRLTEREMATGVGGEGIFGIRLLLEANKEGAPIRKLRTNDLHDDVSNSN